MKLSKKISVGVIGATGMVGRRFISLLSEHPWFEVKLVAASSKSSGKSYYEALDFNWDMPGILSSCLQNLKVYNAFDIVSITKQVQIIFCAVDLPSDQILELENEYAKNECVVVSNNSAHRKTPDVPMIIPEINPEHLEVIKAQKKRLGTERGFIVVKPNCSLQSFVPPISPLLDYDPNEIMVSTYQAISGAGKTFKTWPEMNNNIIPLIGGEEEKTENEPLKIWGKIINGEIVNSNSPHIKSTCVRVPIENGHTAVVYAKFERPLDVAIIKEIWNSYMPDCYKYNLPSAPLKFLIYHEDDNRPQVSFDVDKENGMAINIGRLKEVEKNEFRFVCLSHNTIRGAAGGAVLTAELLQKGGYIE